MSATPRRRRLRAREGRRRGIEARGERADFCSESTAHGVVVLVKPLNAAAAARRRERRAGLCRPFILLMISILGHGVLQRSTNMGPNLSEGDISSSVPSPVPVPTRTRPAGRAKRRVHAHA